MTERDGGASSFLPSCHLLLPLLHTLKGGKRGTEREDVLGKRAEDIICLIHQFLEWILVWLLLFFNGTILERRWLTVVVMGPCISMTMVTRLNEYKALI